MAKTIKIGSIGLAEDEARQLQNIFNLARNELRQEMEWQDGWDAEILLIDDDSMHGHMEWLRAHNLGKGVIAITKRDPRDQEIILRRPYNRPSLINAVNFAAQQLIDSSVVAAVNNVALSRITGEIPSVNAANRRAFEKATPVPVPRKTGELPAVTAPRKTGEQMAVAAAIPAPVPSMPRNMAEFLASGRIQHPLRLVRAGQATLILDLLQDRYYAAPAIKSWSDMFTGALNLADWVDASDADVTNLPNDIKTHPAVRLLWGIAICNSNGRLHPGLDINARYKLNKWPQIEREFPKHFRIATALMKSPANVSEIVEQSGASMAEVCDFINAYVASGVASVDNAPSTDLGFAALANALAARLAS